MPKEIPDDKRQSPEVKTIDENTKSYLANMGYQKIEMPPGMNVSGGQPVQDDRVESINNDAVVGDTVDLTVTPSTVEPKAIPQSDGKRKPVYAVEEEEEKKKVQKVIDDSGSPKPEIKVEKDNQDTGDKSNKEVQSLLDKVRSDKDKEIAELRKNNEATQIQVQTMMQMMQQSGGKVEESAPKKQVTSPKLKDFTKDLGENYNPGDALDMNTESGQAYSAWFDKRDEWLLEKATSGAQENLINKQQNDLVMSKAAEFAKLNPEYQNLDGSPNVSKIMAFFEDIKNGDWHKLKTAMDVINSGDKVINPNPVTSTDIQLNDKANKVNVQAIGNTGASVGSTKITQEEPSTVKRMKAIYGSNFEIPEGIIVK